MLQSGKKLHEQENVGRMMTSGNLDGVMVKALVQKGRDADSIHSLNEIFHIFVTPTTLVDHCSS